ncbi:unnamed protein product, partial [marine sediment metagenome]
GIKPIIGCEVYLAPNSRFSRSASDKSNYHLVLLAKNQTGYRNLIQLTTKANLEGFYYRPRVDRELLERYHQGLIALSACIVGEVPRLILSGRLEEAKQTALWYKQTFGDFYLEIQRHPIPELEQLNQHLIPMSQELDIPLVATNDVHYVNLGDAQAAQDDAGGGAAPDPEENLTLLGEGDDVPHNEQVVGKLRLLYYLQLVVEPFFYLRGGVGVVLG